MTEQTSPRPDSYELNSLRRRRAKRIMDGLTVACVAVIAGIGSSQVVVEGLGEFVNRPPGVGASASDAQTVPTTSPPPNVAQAVPNAPSPIPQSKRRIFPHSR